MGNHSSVQLEPEIEQIFSINLNKNTSNSISVTVTLNLDHNIFMESYGTYTNQISLSIKAGQLGLYPGGELMDNNTIRYEWTPHTTMHDFETIDAFTPDETRIAVGAGICVIIIDNMGMYIKLAYNKLKSCGLDVIVGQWNHTAEAKDMLKGDLYIGYHVLFISGDDFSNKYELKHERIAEPHEGKVWIPGLDKDLEEYKH